MSYKIAYIGDPKWSLGSIHYHMFNNIDSFDCRFFNWSDSKEIQKGLDWCDLAIGTVDLYEFEQMGYNVSSEIIGVFHCDPFLNSSAFNKNFNLSHVNKVYGINNEICISTEKKYNLKCGLLPIGVDTSFWKKRRVDRITRLGFVSRSYNDEYNEVKRPDVFNKVCDTSKIDGKTVYGKHFLCGSYIYKDVDAIICTSVSEGLPTAFLECAAMKLPFISTKVGIVPEYSSVKTFDTVEEAAEILKYLNSDKKILKKYVDDVYDEVIPEREWKHVIDKYWLPEIELSLSK